MSVKPYARYDDCLGVIVTQIETYERRHSPMYLLDAVDAIEFRIEQSGLTMKKLESVIGRKNRMYEIHARRRPLTLG